MTACWKIIDCLVYKYNCSLLGGACCLTVICWLQDLELPPDIPAASTAAESSVFVAPTPGAPPAQRWLQRCNLAAEHVAAGSFDTAMRMLNR